MNSFPNSTFLFARPSAIEGAARLGDFSGSLNLYNESVTPAQADAIATYQDWSAVGNELIDAWAVVTEEDEQLSLGL